MVLDNMDEDRIREIVREELANFNPPKKKRAPNKWQIFLKQCTKEEQGSYPEKVKACSIKYKEKKKNGELPDSSSTNSPPTDSSSPPTDSSSNE